MSVQHFGGAVLLAATLLTAFSNVGQAADGISNTFTPTGIKQELGKARGDIERADYWSAISRLNDIVAGDPRNADAFNLLGFSHRKLQNFDVAERNYRRALRIDPNHKGALEYLGELYLETDRIVEAKEMLVQLEQLCPRGCDELSDLRAAVEGN